MNNKDNSSEDKIAGIAAEYNPFHLGHQYQIKETKKRCAQSVIAVMSGFFTQRGEPAFVEPALRAAAAVQGGADLVVQLPLFWSIASAQKFAHGVISILRDSGVVTHISFGSESGILSKIKESANYIAHSNMKLKTRKYLKQNLSFPKARQAALIMNSGIKNSLAGANPNDLLGIEYILAAEKLDFPVEMFTVKRLGAAYHSKGLPESGYASATSIRKIVMSGLLRASGSLEALEVAKIIDPVRSFLPDTMAQLLEQSIENNLFPLNWEMFRNTLFSMIIQKSPEDLLKIRGINQVIAPRLKKGVKTSSSVKELAESVKTKTITWTRIYRVFVDLLFGFTSQMERMDIYKKPAFIRLLAFNETGRKIAAQMSIKARVPVITDSCGSTLYTGLGKNPDFKHLFKEIDCGRGMFKEISASKYDKIYKKYITKAKKAGLEPVSYASYKKQIDDDTRAASIYRVYSSLSATLFLCFMTYIFLLFAMPLNSLYASSEYAASEASSKRVMDLTEIVKFAIQRDSTVNITQTRIKELILRIKNEKQNKKIKTSVAIDNTNSSGSDVQKASLDMSYDLDTSGYIKDGIRIAGFNLLNTLYQDRRARTELVDKVIDSYIQYLISNDNKKVANESFKSAEAFLKRMEKSFKLKIITPLDLMQARSYFENQNYRLVQAKSNCEKAVGNLNILIGRSYEAPLILKKIEKPEIKDSRAAEYIEYALENRADIRQAVLVQKINRLRLARAKKSFLPQNSLNAGITSSGSDMDFDTTDWRVDFRRTLSFGPRTFNLDAAHSRSNGVETTWTSITFLMNNGLEILIEKERAGQELVRQNLEIRDLCDAVTAKIYSILKDLKVARAREDYLEASLASKKEEFRKKNKEFDLGLETAEQLLDVSGEVVASEAELNSARYNLLRTGYSLIRELDCFKSSLTGIKNLTMKKIE